jgi:hypothetical protein
MIINDINYIETVEAKEVQGGLSFSQALADAAAFGRAKASTFTLTSTFNIADIGNKQAGSVSASAGDADV